jgi:DNA-binding XRE family transcriptional regulator
MSPAMQIQQIVGAIQRFCIVLGRWPEQAVNFAFGGPDLRTLWTFQTGGSASRMDLRDVFATNFRRMRHEKGLSHDDLAYEAEVSRSYLSQIEKGAFYASLKIIGDWLRPLASNRASP